MKLPSRQVLDPEAQKNFDAIAGSLQAKVLAGTGSPEGVVSAVIGTFYVREDGGIGSTLYIKEANSGGDTGWAAK